MSRLVSILVFHYFIACFNVSAAELSFHFSGTITNIDDPTGTLNSSVQIGAPYSVTFTFNLDQPDSDSDPVLGLYYQTGMPYRLSVGDYDVTIPGYSMSVYDNQLSSSVPPYIYHDHYVDTVGTLMSGPTVNGARFLFGRLAMSGGPSSVFASDDLFTTPPDISMFPSRTWHFSGDRGGHTGIFYIYGDVAEMTAVPEPAGWQLGLLVIGVLAVVRKGKKTRKPDGLRFRGLVS